MCCDFISPYVIILGAQYVGLEVDENRERFNRQLNSGFLLSQLAVVSENDRSSFITCFAYNSFSSKVFHDMFRYHNASSPTKYCVCEIWNVVS
jgi:hypothetical protein